MKENPYSAPSPLESTKQVSALLSRNEDGSIVFNCQMNVRSLVAICSRRGSWQQTQIALLASLFVAGIACISLGVLSKSELAFIGGMLLVSSIVWGFAWFGNYMGTEGKHSWKHRTYLQSPFRGIWKSDHCEIQFKDLLVRFQPSHTKYQVNEAGLRFRIVAPPKFFNPANSIPIYLSRDFFRESDWEQILAELAYSKQNALPGEIEFSDDGPKIPVIGLPARWRALLEFAEGFARRWIAGVAGIICLISSSIVVGVRWQFYAYASRLPNWNSSGQFRWYADDAGLWPRYVAAFVVMCGSACLLFFLCWLIWLVRQNAPFLGSKYKQALFWITDTGIWLEGNQSMAFVPWNPEMIRVSHPGGTRLNLGLGIQWLCSIPKRAFRNESDWKSAMKRIESNIRDVKDKSQAMAAGDKF